MRLISGLSQPQEQKSELVKVMFRTLALRYLNTSVTSGSKLRRPGAPPLCRMFLSRLAIRLLGQHGVRIYFLLKDWSGRQGRALYLAYISVR